MVKTSINLTRAISSLKRVLNKNDIEPLDIIRKSLSLHLHVLRAIDEHPEEIVLINIEILELSCFLYYIRDENRQIGGLGYEFLNYYDSIHRMDYRIFPIDSILKSVSYSRNGNSRIIKGMDPTETWIFIIRYCHRINMLGLDMLKETISKMTEDGVELKDQTTQVVLCKSDLDKIDVRRIVCANTVMDKIYQRCILMKVPPWMKNSYISEMTNIRTRELEIWIMEYWKNDSD